MIFKRNNSETLEVKQEMKGLSKKIDDALKIYEEKTLSEREFNLLAEKSDVQNKLIDVQTQNIKLKDELNIKNKTITEKDKELEEYKEKVKNLSLDYSNMIDYKAKCEKLEKEISKANKDLATYEEKYDELEIANDKYFVLNVRDNEIDVCMKGVLSREEMLKYFTDKWYQDESDYCVRYNSDIRNNKYEDSYIFKVLNGAFKEEKLKDLDIICNVRLLTKEEVENLDDEHRNINKYYWTMTPYNNMDELKFGSNAYVFVVSSDGYLGAYSVYGTAPGLRPVITLRTETL